MYKSRGILSFLTVLAVLAGLQGTAFPAESIKTFVSIPPQAYFVERIGGEYVNAEVMVGPGQSPATYEPTPKQMAALTETELFFRIGVPFENSWLDRIASGNPQMRIIDCRDGLALRQIESHSHHEEHSGKEEDHSHEEEARRPDPHTWLSPARVKIMARTITAALIKAKPELKNTFTNNMEGLINDLDELDKEIKDILAPHKGKKFLVFHPAWGYFADDYGLIQVPVEIEGKSPTIRAMTGVIEEAKKLGIKVIFVQKQFSRSTARVVAMEIGGKVVPMDPLDRDYINNLKFIAKTLAENL
jgi:zinc transport system substrate-binding protein